MLIVTETLAARIIDYRNLLLPDPFRFCVVRQSSERADGNSSDEWLPDRDEAFESPVKKAQGREPAILTKVLA